MASTASRSPELGPTVLLFGPQALSFGQKALETLITSLGNTEDCQWIVDVLAELPSLWKRLVEKLPKLQEIPGEKLLHDLHAWFKTGNVDHTATHLPNIILTPIVVLTQIKQFARYLHLSHSGASNKTFADAHAAFTERNVETIGFCTGLLSASVVSSFFDRDSFRQYGAVAVRLAMIIGALVDAQDASDRLHGRAKSFAVAWSSDSMAKDLVRILDSFPEAYVSVLYDEKRATVTTSQGTAPLLLRQLRQSGVTASEVGLRGRFHSECHHDDLNVVLELCDADKALQFPDISQLKIPIHIIPTDQSPLSGKLHDQVLRMILTQQSRWFETFASVQRSQLQSRDSIVVSFGPDRGVPPSLMRKLGPRLVQATDLDQAAPRLAASALDPTVASNLERDSSDNDIAIVGMSCQVAGASDLGEFWDVLKQGKSQHIEVPAERFGPETQFRDVDAKRKWYGNFIKDHDVFDHRFFKKSPREIVSTDPQQRLMLQAAYQAVEQSGYFHQPNPDTNIGCYIGACAADYEHNVAGYAPNAFTATGNLKSFIAGKISHYFGWTGPGLTIDTACSASAVAIHQACRAIIGGECSAALAGGVAIMGNIIWFQNLAGASFLSPTGQCKPWDDAADGYCRGEAIACVLLKKMSTAIADGNQILGCIASTAVTQNENCTPVFVPNSPSLSSLFKNVLDKAKLDPRQISVVEAHGTGTPVGDPAEYESIRRALAGPLRDTPVSIGSAKGFVGHTEGASGVVSLIKTILMLQEGLIPPQASFRSLSHHIRASPADMMHIPVQLEPWDVPFRASLINNYGASGSNASMIVTQPPFQDQDGTGSSALHASGVRHPFWFCGLDDRSLQDYVRKLLKLIQTKNVSSQKLTLANIAFNICRQSNRTLERRLVFSCNTIDDLEANINAYVSGDKNVSSSPTTKQALPVIMCFGGQTAKQVGLDRKVYESVNILRSYLDQCNAVFLSIGLEGIYPGIFEREPIEDPCRLQTMLFAIQYACAKSWIDCGVQVTAAVGHSFGELTALCVSGILSLKDTAKMIAGRARLVRDSWGPDRGAMMAIEADLDVVQKLLQESAKLSSKGTQATIACYNGPRGFTLAGTTNEIDAVSQTLSSSKVYSSTTRTKRLNVTNAFHSTLVEPLLEDLEEIGSRLTFREASISLERSTEEPCANELSSNFVADHMRNPVYFNHAVQRLSRQYPKAIWLEAGSNSTITMMASRALGSPLGNHFQAMNITSDNGLQNIADVTLALWKAGSAVTYWPHHASQTHDYGHIFLPPYQFEKARHWMDLKKPQRLVAEEAETSANTHAKEETPMTLWTFTGYEDSQKRRARFRINTTSKVYEEFISGHWIAQTAPICPATLEVDMAIEALKSIRPELASPSVQPMLQDMENHSPICIDQSRTVWLDFEAIDEERRSWAWSMVSTGGIQKAGASSKHVHGKLVFRSVEDPRYRAEFARYERLTSYDRCRRVLNGDAADSDIIQGRHIYKAFAEIVDYGEQYRGLKKLVGLHDQCAGRVVKKHAGSTWLDVHLSDCFSQVGGIWVNCMTDRSAEDMFIATGCELLIRNPEFRADGSQPLPETWEVLACHKKDSESMYTTDVFTFNPTNGRLEEAMLGIKFARVAKASMQKILARLSPSIAKATQVPVKVAVKHEPMEESSNVPNPTPIAVVEPSKKLVQKSGKESTQSSTVEIRSAARALLADISGLEPHEIADDMGLADIGIDSLMGMELASEVQTVFKCDLPMEKLLEVVDFSDFVSCIRSCLGVEESSSDNTDSDNDSKEDDSEENTSSSSPPSSVDANDVSDKFDSLDAGSTGRVPQPRSAASDLSLGPISNSDLKISESAILDAFGDVKKQTDQMIRDFKIDNFAETIFPKSTQLCIALTLEAFEKLGVSIKSAKTGDLIPRIQHAPQHQRLVEYLYNMLEQEARLVDNKDGTIIRTAISVPTKSSNALLQDLLRLYPDWSYAMKLTHFAGSRLTDVLTDKTDGIKIIFGSDEGRDLVGGLYRDHVFNQMNYTQMAKFVEKLIAKLQVQDGPLRILEMGAGTGGTTFFIAPLLARLGIAAEYTFTDLSPSMVSAAKKLFAEYPFMKFQVHDIEKEVPADIVGTQHIVIASNAVHATHDLVKSAKNIRQALRPDGLLMMLEMTEIVPFVDVIFGLLEGWWLFDDGRKHAIAHQDRWEQDLKTAGFGHVDYTDGHLPENRIQKVIIAMASGSSYPRLPLPDPPTPRIDSTDVAVREKDVITFIKKYSANFLAPTAKPTSNVDNEDLRQTVLITGASGNLGTQLVKACSERDDVESVVCLNRKSASDPLKRQHEAFEKRGVSMDGAALAKVRVLETDTTKPRLGLGEADYATLVDSVSAIIHNAWPMSGKRTVKGLEGQFQVMRNLIDFARDIACKNEEDFKVTFQLISSIGVVGHHPLWSGVTRVPEERMQVRSVLPNGYCDAKYTCECMLDETLHKFPTRFRTMTARLGQVAGSSVSGYWNPMEHFPFLLKSCKSLRIIPDLPGVLSWCPVDFMAIALSELLLDNHHSQPQAIYHIDNPKQQPWSDMTATLADALNIPPSKIIPFSQWITRVKRSPLSTETDNPAAKLIDFLAEHFQRMSCGGLILDTSKACEDSKTLRMVGLVTPQVARKYVKSWESMGFL